MGRLVVIEGLDGAGKRTFAGALTAALVDEGACVATFAFPRYDADVHAELARDALYGRMGDLTSSVNAMALLFALDRRAAAPDLRAALADHDVVLVDRYVASNAAYSAARMGQQADGDVVDWVRRTEIDRFGIPVPDHQLLLAPPRAVAAERAMARAVSDPGRPRDAYESDDLLQARTDAVYRELADLGWLGRWTVLDGAEGARPGARSTAAVVGPGDRGPRASGADPTDPASLIPALLHG
ncbi:dTMP kinase [Pseudonocardia alni subsp. carboxydivorans]|uniref:Thymidylate kinase n=1 Tax=Pseudonocardia alni subsp. carboxydivorans TaxID=415010 RepID=A0ABU9A705_PSEA5